VSGPPRRLSKKVIASDVWRLRRMVFFSIDMGGNLFNGHELSYAIRADLINRPPLAAESNGPLASSLPLQRLIMEAWNTSSCFQPLLLNGFNPRHELVNNVTRNPSKLPASLFRDSCLEDHLSMVAL